MSENSLSIIPAEQLVSGTEYTLTLLPEAETQDEISIGEAQDMCFMTTAQTVDIVNASLFNTDNTLKFSGNFVDDSGIFVRVIAVLYDADGRIQQVKIEDPVPTGPINTEVEVSENNKAKIFCVTDDFQNVIGEKIITYIGGQN